MYEDFKAVCQYKIPRLLRDIKNRNLYIWGAGKGGRIVEEVLWDMKVPVCGFVDQKADSIKMYLGYPVKKLTDVSPEKDYLLISLMNYDRTIYDQIMCTEWKKNRKSWFYLYENSNYNEEDIIHRGCRIGRYTYGYESLLQFFPLAESIGRFCSINESARILANHVTDAVTLHPMLYYGSYIENLNIKEDITLKCSVYIKESDRLNRFLRINKPVVIGNDVWIGADVSIVPGITIGDGAILGAGAVVTHDVEPYAVMGGVPARLIKYRFSKEIRNKLLEIKWWDWSMDKIEQNMDLFWEPERFIKEFL